MCTKKQTKTKIAQNKNNDNNKEPVVNIGNLKFERMSRCMHKIV